MGTLQPSSFCALLCDAVALHFRRLYPAVNEVAILSDRDQTYTLIIHAKLWITRGKARYFVETALWTTNYLPREPRRLPFIAFNRHGARAFTTLHRP
ncbi:hypothetical protein BURKHO8Y_240135 [Burkholderia sp. 8Y]|nr:hypothetical protein BURKHO8Y_240135 [Burkholderia sp. 8Y]